MNLKKLPLLDRIEIAAQRMYRDGRMCPFSHISCKDLFGGAYIRIRYSYINREVTTPSFCNICSKVFPEIITMKTCPCSILGHSKAKKEFNKLFPKKGGRGGTD